MSRDAEDLTPRRGPKPSAQRPSKREVRDVEDDFDDPSAWSPNPASERSGSRKVKSVPPGPTGLERILFGRISSGQLSAFCRQFAAYLDAGVDIFKALGSLETQYARTALGPVLGRVRARIRQGDTLTEALSRETRTFDSMMISLIKVAEARGGVPETLKRLSSHYAARQNLIRQARSAMIYPIAVLILGAFVGTIFCIWLLPMFASMMKEVAGNATLPLPSRILLQFSDFLTKMGWWFLPLVLIGTPIAGFQIYRTPTGKRLMDGVALKLPVLGLLLKKLETTRFARTLSVLLGSGLNITHSLDLTSEVLQLDPYKAAIHRMRGAVSEGESLADSIHETRRFGVDVVSIVESGEETGNLPESLERVADDYDEQVAFMVKNLGQLIQPILYVILGAFVLFLILSVFLPYLSILTNLAGGS